MPSLVPRSPALWQRKLAIDKLEDLNADLFHGEVENVADNAELSQLRWSGLLKNLL